MEIKNFLRFTVAVLFTLSLTHCGVKEGVLLQRVADLTDSSADSQDSSPDGSSSSNSGADLKSEGSDANDDDDDDSNQSYKFLCHVPTGNPSKAKTLKLKSARAINAHINNHGDYLGRCCRG